MYKKAATFHPDWPEKLFGEWILFERECGTLETFEIASEKFQAQVELANQRRVKEYESSQQQQQHHAHSEKPKDREKKREPKGKDGKEAKEKKDHGAGESSGKGDKKRKRETPEEADHDQQGTPSKKSKAVVDQEGFKVPVLPGKKKTQLQEDGVVEEAAAAPKQHEVQKEEEMPEVPKNPYSLEETKEVTVFLSNLSFKVTEDLISEKFIDVRRAQKIFYH